MYTSGLQGREDREVRYVMRLTDFRLVSIWDLFKNATHRSHLPTQKMLRTAELQVLAVLDPTCSKQVLW